MAPTFAARRLAVLMGRRSSSTASARAHSIPIDDHAERRLFGAMFNPARLSAAQLAFAQQFFAAPCTFVRSCTTHTQLPPPGTRREIAVLGRSNVGKSSLLNALMSRDIVKTSARPGFTRHINLFHVGTRLALIDLPGYGFNSTEQQMNMVGGLLRERQSLAHTCVLVDSEHGIKEIDRYAIQLLEQHQVPYQVVLTKSDKLGAVPLRDQACRACRVPSPHVCGSCWPPRSLSRPRGGAACRLCSP